MNDKTILLVDDESLIRATLTKELGEAGFAVFTAESGAEAEEILKKEQIDLVVTDLKMEGISGIQLLQKVKEADGNLPVIILTGFGDMYSAIEALRAGAEDYLLKPCAVEELVVRVTGCLEKAELRKKVKLYEDILPICSVCKKIRDDAGVEPGRGKWLRVETYIERKAGVSFTHSYCDECHKALLDEVNNTKSF